VFAKSFVTAWLAVAVAAAGCATSGSTRVGTAEAERPGRTVRETLKRAIALLERADCPTFAVNFLSPIKRDQIKDLEAYRKQRECGPNARANVDEVLLAMRLALRAEPSVQGVKATIDLSGIGLRVTKFEFVKYVDGLWYFNEL